MWRSAPWVIVSLVVGGACSPAAEPAVPAAPGNAIGPPITPRAPRLTATADAAPPADTAPAEPSPPRVEVIDAPMRWSEARAAETLHYRRAHSDPAAKDLVIEPRVIVLHYTGGGSAQATRRYFDEPRIEPGRVQLARAGAVNVSSHFLVDRDGTIFQLQPETRYARHCIGLNHIAIGIENVGDGRRWPLTDAQIAANIALVRDLVGRHAVTHLVGHHEVMAWKRHPYYVELDRHYGNSKPDPGAAFMARVRAGVAELGLQQPSGGGEHRR